MGLMLFLFACGKYPFSLWSCCTVFSKQDLRLFYIDNFEFYASHVILVSDSRRSKFDVGLCVPA